MMGFLNKKRGDSSVVFGVRLFFVIGLFGLIIFPLLRLFSHISVSDFSKIVGSPQFVTNVLHSIIAGTLCSIITISIAFFAAYALARSNIKGKNFFAIVLTLPMLIPSISHGIAVMRLFGNNGFFTKLLGLSTGIGGLWGIVCGSFLYAFPVAFIMFYDVFQYEDSTVYSAAETLGIGKVRAFLSLTLPYMRKSLIITTFAIFALVVTDYGVPLAVGGRYGTIPQVMYSEVIGRFNFSTGSIYALFLLVPAIVAFIADHLLTENKGGLLIRSNFILRKSTVRDVCSYILSGLLLIVALLPVITFAVIAFAKNYPNDMSLSIDSILQVSKSGAFRYLSNSIVIAFITSIVGVPLTYAIAYLVVRTEAYAGKKSKTLLSFLHLLALLSMAIPGLVLGLSFIFTYKGTLIYGTLLVLVIVNLAHFISSPYLMIYNSMRIQNENLEQVGATLGIRRWRVIVGVLIPQQKSTLFEMFAYFFVNCMITISAVSFLANSATKPISLVINVYEEQMNVGAVAVISLVILVVNLIIKGAVELTKKISEKETRRI